MRNLLIGLALIAAPAFAEGEWVMLGHEDAGAALSDKSLVYEDGASQVFGAGGDTTYTSDGKPSQGRWGITEGRYCSVWPPSDRWSCYDLERSADGTKVRFVADDGSSTVGAYQ